ncbi:hypothetical protein [Polynucleobacter necessarius]|uniref:hypothetical protein n=1 Tax=Polynucleobacter necessarius TaxID=576610 RepID=UPI001E29E376|nr:hypothetical protein [Polynucleobacter necessarius]
MDTTLTVILGIVAMLLPLIVGRLFWKCFDHYFGRNDEAYMDTLGILSEKNWLHRFNCFHYSLDWYEPSF